MTFSQNRLLDFLFGCVFVVGLLACLALIPVFFARQYWVFDLFTHFRVQLSLGLLVAALLLLFSARKKLSLLFLGVLCVYLTEILPFYIPGPACESGTELKVILVNVNSSSGDPEQVLAYLQNTDAGLIVIQEFSSRWSVLSDVLASRYPYQMEEIREDNFGMALFSTLPLSGSEIFYFTEEEVPSLSTEFHVGERRVFLLATHPVPPVSAAYAAARNRQLQEVAAFLADNSGPLILLGDLNSSPWSPVFKDLIESAGLQNSMQGFGIQPTWPSFIPLLWTPLDHLLHSAELSVIDRRIGPDVGSDHFPLEVTLSLP
jgi:endonuclease/exonuclease/phosphatase (EEP) superfamily protein YafD